MIPTIGRSVHYYGKFGTEQTKARVYAAIITNVELKEKATVMDEDSYDVTVCVFFPNAITIEGKRTPFSAEYEECHWSWPPKVV